MSISVKMRGELTFVPVKGFARGKLFNLLVLVLPLFIAPVVYSSPTTAGTSGLKLEKPSKVIEAPDFLLKTPKGEGGITLKQYRGKVVLLNFWATWCGPCAKEMPSLDRLFKKFSKSGLMVIAIAANRGSPLSVTGFLRKNAITLPVVLDSDGNVRNIYEVTALPFTYIIDRNGRFIGRLAGEVDWDTPDIHKFFTELLNTPVNSDSR